MKRHVFCYLLCSLLASSVMFSSPVYAADTQSTSVGGIKVRAIPKNEGKDTHVPKTKEEYVDLNSVGNLPLIGSNSPKKISTKQRWVTKEQAQDISATLGRVVKAHTEKNYGLAKEEMQKLLKKYPENGLFYKWVAIYQNLNKEYLASEETIERLRMMFPLDSEAVRKDPMIRYYEIDNARRSGAEDAAKAYIADLRKDSVSVIKDERIGDLTTRRITEILCAYQELLINNKDYHNVDKQALGKLWGKIPKSEQYQLDNFYGYNIDNLAYIYGVAFNRKDILSHYVENEKLSDDAEVVAQLKHAKQIIRNKY